MKSGDYKTKTAWKEIPYISKPIGTYAVYNLEQNTSCFTAKISYITWGHLIVTPVVIKYNFYN